MKKKIPIGCPMQNNEPMTNTVTEQFEALFKTSALENRKGLSLKRTCQI